MLFNKRDKQQVNNQELNYIKALYQGSDQPGYMLAKINSCLKQDNLEFDGEEKYIVNNNGGCARIFLMEQDGEFRLLKKQRQDDNKSRIANEYKIAAMLGQQEDGEKYIVKALEFRGDDSYSLEVADDTLEHFVANVMKKNDTFSGKLDIIMQIVNAVRFVHFFGYMHRDLHPGNIFYIKGRWKLGDFGFATHFNDAWQDAGKEDYGRKFFAAPEQLLDLSKATFVSEIYSLGKLINYILTKKPNDDIHPLTDIVKKCVNKNPAHRYQSVQELKSHLDSMILPFVS